MNLIDLFEGAAESTNPVWFLNGETERKTTWGEVHEQAKGVAATLQARGIGVGDHIGLIGPTSDALVVTIQGVLLAGATVVMLPLPMRMASLEVFIEQTRRRLHAGDVSLLVMDEQFVPFWTTAVGDPEVVPLAALQEGDPGEWKRVDVDADALAVLQFTSGSTAQPKGVMLSHRNVVANLHACAQGGQLVPDDVFISWLPLYHDMGLIGFLFIPMCFGASLVQAPPQDFLARPIRWMEWVTTYRGTCLAGPNFSYALVARALRKAEGLDLSTVRVALNGAEPVDADAFRRFLAAGAGHGLSPDSAYPAFGMAELCIGGAFPVRGSGLQTEWVDLAQLEAARRVVRVAPGTSGAKEMVYCGVPLPGLEMRIRDPETCEDLGSDDVGELWIRGESVTAGYYRDPGATAAGIVDGWLRTGDLAYLNDRGLVICGRIKDVIIVGGRNVHPQDIEWAVGSIEGIRAGNVIAFGVGDNQGSQHIVVVAEAKDFDPPQIRAEISRRVRDHVQVPPRVVILVPPGTIPKTSSGKLQRSECKSKYESDGYREYRVH